MKLNQQHACHECDLLIALPAYLPANKTLVCPRCASKQFTHYANALDHSIAFSLCALIFLFIANIFPFLSFETQGQIRTITMFEASHMLYTQGFVLLSMLVYAFVILFPTLFLIFVLMLLVPIKLRKKPIEPVLLGKAISYVLPWSMAEVFMVGVLVALIKVIELASIIFGVSFWAYLAFVLFFIATASVVSKQQLWAWIEQSMVKV